MSEKNPIVFVVDDDASVREAIRSLIRSVGWKVETFGSAQEFLCGQRSDAPGCLVLDVRLPGLSGLDLQRELAAADIQIPIVFITGHGDIPMTVRAMKAGAVEFLTKPFLDEELLDAIEQAIDRDRLARHQQLEASEQGFGEIVGQSEALKSVLKQVKIVAPTSATVLIQGETGTGKELVARAIHQLSPRRNGPFVRVNCAAIPLGLLESELFGHERGAFTGALAQKIGRFELAHQGTLFLDEVGDIPLELQPKLLRVLQEQEFERLGSTRTLRVDVRLVAATHRNLLEMSAERQFRSDLYFRLNVFPLSVPPLRQRQQDLPLLVRHFVDRYARGMKKQIDTIPPDVLEALSRYSWPGNIRELQNFIERAVILSQSNVLRPPLHELKGVAEAKLASEKVSSVTTLEEAERELILRALSETNGRIGGPKGAAVRLGLKRTTLLSKMERLNISRRPEGAPVAYAHQQPHSDNAEAPLDATANSSQEDELIRYASAG
jgi:DNA-binding NtrC family response regulator